MIYISCSKDNIIQYFAFSIAVLCTTAIYKINPNMKKLFFLLFLAVATLTSCQSQNSAAEDETVLSVEAYQEKLSASEDVQLLDVRTPREYEAGHIEGAVNINYLDEDFLSQVEQRFKKGETVMLYCRSGSRSTKAKAIMEEADFEEIYDLEGGFNQWPKK